MKIDIRNLAAPQQVTLIDFAENFSYAGTAQADQIHIVGEGFDIHETETGDYVRIRSKEQAENLILAIRKATELCQELKKQDIPR